MARLFDLGFELQSVTAGVEYDTNLGTTLAISTNIKRSGGSALRANLSAGNGAIKHQYRASGATTKVFFRFALYIASAPSADTTILGLGSSTVDSGANGLQLQLKTDRTLQLNYWDGAAQQNVGSPSSALTANQWNVIEVTYDDSDANNTITARVNGASTFASGNGGNLGGNGFFFLGAQDTTTCDLYYDDVSINDTSGSAQTSYPGLGYLTLLRPNEAGDVNTFGTQTGGTAGAGNNYTRVNETTPNDATSFNGSSTLNQEDLFNLDASCLGADDTINCVTVGFRFRNSTADATAAIKLEIEKTGSGTITQSSAIVPNSTTWRTNAAAAPRTPPLILYNNPDGSAWTRDTLDTMQIGYKLTTAPGTAGRRIDVSNIWAYVDYIPVPSNFTMASGTFTGNGSSQSISGLGFAPDLVIIHDDSSTAGVRTSWRSRAMSGDKTASFVGAIANFANGITSLDSNGFTVGSSNDTNENTKTIHWVAFKGVGNNFAYGRYKGTGAAQTFSNLGFDPNLVVAKMDSTTSRGTWITSSNSSNNSMKFENVANYTGGFTAIGTGGFTLGTNANTNTSGSDYYWFAFKNTTSQFAVGSYTTTGSPSDNRSVTGVGFQPQMTWIKVDNTQNAALRLPTNSGDQSYDGFDGASLANVIQQMESDGFQLGTNNTVQVASSTFYYAAWNAPVTSFIKTIDGLARASVKVVNGLAIASVKTWDGLT